MSITSNLPFPRGSTASCQGLADVTLSDTTWDALEGREYIVKDTEHGTGKMVTLMVVKADGTAITTANQLVKFSTTSANDWGRRVVVNDTGGGVVMPVDDAYTASTVIAANDLFYVVTKGPCDIMAEATASAINSGESVTAEVLAIFKDPAAAGEYVIGSAMEDATESTVCLINVTGDLSLPPAAG